MTFRWGGGAFDDLVEYAIEGINDATNEPTIPVVSNTISWICDIKNGRGAN